MSVKMPSMWFRIVKSSCKDLWDGSVHVLLFYGSAEPLIADPPLFAPLPPVGPRLVSVMVRNLVNVPIVKFSCPLEPDLLSSSVCDSAHTSIDTFIPSIVLESG